MFTSYFKGVFSFDEPRILINKTVNKVKTQNVTIARTKVIRYIWFKFANSRTPNSNTDNGRNQHFNENPSTNEID